MTQQITISVPIIHGYEATGEYRIPRVGEEYITSSGRLGVADEYDNWPEKAWRIILRKKWSFPAWFATGWWLRHCSDRGNWFVTRSNFCDGIMAAESLWAFHGEKFTPPSPQSFQCVR